jgi:NAD(P)-dependent dehydrogenase (short-subunit alcohol dehydrogenase family)
MTTSHDPVVVVTGAGGMGTAIARRLGPGATVLLADVDEESIERTTQALTASGYTVVGRQVDVSQRESVEALATTADELGPVTTVVHTAGLSPVQAPVDAILRVDLLGTALMLDAFGEVIARGGAGVFIASMAGAMASVDAAVEALLATTPTDQLLGLSALAPDVLSDAGTAYTVAKRANQVRVRAAAASWGRRGARVNSVSPGVIATPMGEAELDGASGEIMRAMIAGSATGRIGTADDIAAAVDFLTSRQAGYVTGTDLLVDGGVVASLFAPRP